MYVYTRASLTGHPREDPREEKRARRTSRRGSSCVFGSWRTKLFIWQAEQGKSPDTPTSSRRSSRGSRRGCPCRCRCPCRSRGIPAYHYISSEQSADLGGSWSRDADSPLRPVPPRAAPSACRPRRHGPASRAVTPPARPEGRPPCASTRRPPCRTVADASPPEKPPTATEIMHAKRRYKCTFNWLCYWAHSMGP